MKILNRSTHAIIAALALTACGVTPSTSVVDQSATTCVSDPIAGGDNFVGRCPPPNPAIAAAAAVTYADHNYPGVPRVEGGCNCDASYCMCALIIWFGGGQNIIIDCSTDQQGNVTCDANSYDG